RRPRLPRHGLTRLPDRPGHLGVDPGQVHLRGRGGKRPPDAVAHHAGERDGQGHDQGEEGPGRDAPAAGDPRGRPRRGVAAPFSPPFSGAAGRPWPWRTETTRSTSPPSKTSLVPSGQVTVRPVTRVTSPRPKWTRGSLLHR